MVKSRCFKNYRDIGAPRTVARVLNHGKADELILLNVDHANRTIAPLLEVLPAISAEIFVPLTVGGGIRAYDDAKILLAAGVEKVVINSAAYDNILVMREVSKKHGAQAVCASVDVLIDDWEVYCVSDCGRHEELIPFREHLDNIEQAGAGELLIQFIERDGLMQGLPVDLVQSLCDHTALPLVVAGGVGSYKHLIDTFKGSAVSGIGVGSLFSFTDSNPIRARAACKNAGVNVR